MNKRIFDIVLGAILLLMSLPLLLVLAVAVLACLGAPVLYRHDRPGFRGRPFVLLKFRTMRNAENQNGETLPDADRLTPFGRWLRSTSLDELPELINVLKGDMSLVGPRPLLMEYLPLYSPFQARRHDVRPGLTGWAQVRGRNSISWEEKFDFDVWYVENHTLLLDIRILWMTIKKVLNREDITQPGSVSVARFRGSTE